MRDRFFFYLFNCCLLLLAAACSIVPGLPAGKLEARLFPSMLLLVDSGEAGLCLRPVDPASLEDLPGYTPLELGHHYDDAFSPDGRTLAAIVWPTGWSSAGELHLIDLSTWEAHPAGLRFDNYISLLAFSPDGESLYWSVATNRSSAHGLPGGFELRRYDIAAQEEHTVASLPFGPTDARLFSAGSRMALYGVPIDDGNLAADWPHLLIVDLVAQASPDALIRADIRLDGLIDGQRQVSVSGGQPAYQYDRAGLGWDLARQRLYIVHPTQDKVTVVDLAREQVVREARIQPSQSLIERVLAWFASPALAKAVPGTEHSVVLSPDGAYLHIVSLRRELEEGAWGSMIWRQVPLGLQIVDTRRFHSVHRVDLPLNTLALSPDGERLLLTGFHDETTFNESHRNEAGGLYLLDTQNKTPILLMHPPGQNFLLHGFSPDSRYAYFSAYNSDTGGDLLLQVLDLESLEITGERHLPSGFADLLGAIWSGK